MADLISMLAAASGIGAEEADPNFKQTVLLLHGDGTNGAQNNTFLDSGTANGGVGFTITRNPATGPNAPTQGTFSPFSLAAGEWSNYFDGSGDRLSSSGSVNSAAGTSDFCVEFFVYYARYPAQFTTIFSTKLSNTGTATGYGIGVENDGTIYNYSNAYITESASGVFSLNTWHHMVFTRSGTTARLFLNGVLRATGTNSQDFSNQGFAVGSHNGASLNEPMDGYVSNVRFVKGSIPTTYQTSSTTVGDTIFTVPTAPLSTSSQGATSADVEILTCQSNRFVDNSTNAFIITGAGDVRVTPFSPFAPSAAYSAGTNGGSGYFDGTGDYLSIADNVAFEPGTGNFSLQGWVYHTTAAGSLNMFFEQAGGGLALYRNSSGKLELAQAGVAALATSTNNMPVNAWTYVEASRSGTSLKLFINGAEEASVTNSTNLAGTASVGIGGGVPPAASNSFTGYLSNWRLLKGAVDNTSAYTPPTAPLTNITNTSLLLNFTNAGIFDQTGKNNLETVGDAQIDTAVKKFGTGSMKFDGTGDYLIIPDSPELWFSNGNFTVELWANFSVSTSGVTYVFVGQATDAFNVNAGWMFSRHSGNKLRFIFTDDGTGASGYKICDSTNNFLPTTGVWYHLAATRSGNTFKLFIDGVEVGSATLTASIFNSTRPITIGADSAGAVAFNGYIDDLRITKGVARYDSNFPPPTAAFPNE